MLNSLYQKIKGNNKLYLLPDLQLRKMGLIYNIYRFVISLFLFLTSYALTFQDNKIVVSLPSFLYQTILLFYGVFSFLLLVLFYLIPRYMRRQLGIGLIFDVLIISILLYLTGTPDLQLTMLYMVVVAASFMMLAPYQGFIITLLAIIFVIYQQFFYAINNTMSISDLGNAILLSLSFLCVGFLSWFLSQRLAMVEKIASQQANEVAKLNVINQQVISTIVHGVMVLSDNLALKLTNLATINLLALNLPSQDLLSLNQDSRASDEFISLLSKQHPTLFKKLTLTSHTAPSSFIYDLTDLDSMVNKLRINTTPLEDGSLLVVIEDIRRENSSAQQLKLAALGQLTASIAHEIRNPLAAISQASQLLIEDVDLIKCQATQLAANASSSKVPSDVDNIELYQMIYKQTKRVNRIIEDVLNLSRQGAPDLITFDLVLWLKQFINEHYATHDIFLDARCTPKIHFDTHQLEQILVNLINNGLKFSSKSHPHAYVEIEVHCRKNDVILDVLDLGSGVPVKHHANLFNPFFTTNADGTGLGLYLSQAFAEANHSRLVFVPEHEKTCFRLVIPKVIFS